MDRNIFRYHDGTRDVAADPAVIWRRINAGCRERGTTWLELTGRWTELSAIDAATAAPADPGAWLDLQGIVADVAREAFGLRPLDADGDGLTEDEVMAVLTSFIEDREKKENPPATSASSSAPTGGGRRGSSRRSSARSATPKSTG